MSDEVNNPAHYNNHPSGIECIEISAHHDFCIGNVIKYCWRAGRKGSESELKDLRKAEWYLKKKIALLEQAEKTASSAGGADYGLPDAPNPTE